ncbi:MAG: DUF4340 domain-containing protein [Planctomycetes bacterium]|nr:DUF4340 domain-containing protein [Planctomycetota bacterium]
MNFKTTAVLFVLVVGVAVTIYMLPEQNPKYSDDAASPPPIAETKTQKLLGADLGEAQLIRVSQTDSDDWIFERSANDDDKEAVWYMKLPYTCKVSAWQIKSLAGKIRGLEYTSRYDGSSGNVTAANTGLQPPRVTVSLTDDNDATTQIHIGRDEGNREAYVSLNDESAIYRVNASLKDLLKESALAYHEQKMFDVEANDIVRIEIQSPNDNGTTESYVMVKTGAEWRFEKPSPAKGHADKIRRLCSTFAAMRAQEWVAGNVSDLAQYGLASDTRTILVTAETTVDVGTNGSLVQRGPMVSTHRLHLSNASPLGEDTKIYARRGDENLVATIAKNLADTFKPNLKEWRDNRLIERDPATARSLTLTLDSKTTQFERSGTDWKFAESRNAADGTEVNRLLSTIKDLRAVNFVAAGSQTEHGFDKPEATIELKFDGNSPTATFTIGGFTDTISRKLTYVKANDTIAKVKTIDIKPLLRSASIYRDRIIVALPKDRLQSITIERPASGNWEPAVSVTLEQANGEWSMTSPGQHRVDKAQMDRLLSTLANLRANEIIDVTEDTDLSTYGLDRPAVRMIYTSLPPKAYRVIPDAITSNGTNRVEPIQPPAETFDLTLGQANGKIYVQRGATPEFVYTIAETLLADFIAEYRTKDIFAFEPNEVTEVSFADAQTTVGLNKADAGWVYMQEPDLPMDQAKVANYLLRIRNVKIGRVVEYGASDFPRYGLDSPRYTLSLTLTGGKLPTLLVSENKDDQGEHYAKSADSNDVFTVAAETISQIAIDVEEFEQAG